MKRTIILMRHAKTEPLHYGQKDFDRDLTERGRQDAAQMGQSLAQKGYHPDIILHSNANRTTQTMEIIRQTAGYSDIPQTAMSRLYHASADVIETAISAQTDSCNTCMLIGHNPGISQFASDCVPGCLDHELPTSGLVVFTFEGEWTDFAQSKKKIELYDYPKK